ncbi:hypothetical protein ABN028_30735 [Actinopolymorpha sp. B17G11]|uniref:hypothetical protein n=1 Tax=Actinopolymorpha sp. B17G11 TaxID=3160861 RepID=UPI0032E45AA2
MASASSGRSSAAAWCVIWLAASDGPLLLVDDLPELLEWAGVTTMRWNRNDQYPHREFWRREALKQLRAALDRQSLN